MFDLIASFADHATRSTMSRVDLAWLARFHPLKFGLLGRWFWTEDRAKVVQLLTRGVSRPSSLSSAFCRLPEALTSPTCLSTFFDTRTVRLKPVSLVLRNTSRLSI